MTCVRCGQTAPERHYRGKAQKRCACYGDYRTPMEKRADEIADRYGTDPSAYTGKALGEIANGPIYRARDHYCPAGKLSMLETKAREAAAIIK